MVRVHFVKRARKDYPDHGIAKGESYYWWKPKIGGRGSYKRYSKTRPRPSQTTTSEFFATWFSLGELIEDFDGSHDDLQGLVDHIVSELYNLEAELEEKKENLPENFRQSASYDLLEERIGTCQEWKSFLESFSCDDDCSIDELKESLTSDIPSPP